LDFPFLGSREVARNKKASAGFGGQEIVGFGDGTDRL
jgi:hypothetical protein